MATISQFDLTGRVAIVTGAGGLLGLHHCKILAQAGARVIGIDAIPLTALSLRIAKTIPRELHQQIEPYQCNITSKTDLTVLRNDIERKHGRPGILVNNAAWNDAVEHRDEITTDPVAESSFEEYSLELWNKSLIVNLTGTFLASQVFGTPMAKAGSGSIINLASTYGLAGPDQSLYVDADGKRYMYKSPSYPTTKGGVIAFTRYLAAYWGSAGVRVNSLSPGGVENGQSDHFIGEYSKRTMLGRMAGPADYEGAILFLASDASAYMTGANLIVDGGWTAW